MTTVVKLTLAASLLGSAHVMAQDPASAAGDLAEISAISVQSKAVLTEAALGGDVEAIAEASKRSDAVDAAMAQAQEAYSSMERALENGDQDTAESAIEDLESALEKAMDAFNGVIPDDIQEAAEQIRINRKNSGTRGRPYDRPNVYNVPWNSQTMQDFYQNHFANLWESGIYPHDRETTPE